MFLGANARRTTGRDRPKAVRAGSSFHLSTAREMDTFKNSSSLSHVYDDLGGASEDERIPSD
jgi:hypothetical protein